MTSGSAFRRWLTWGLALALVLRALWVTSARLTGVARDSYAPAHVRPFADISDRFEPLHGRFPPDQVVGYASSFRPEEMDFAVRLLIARYVLAPLTLEAHDSHRFVIADFRSPERLAEYVKASRGLLRAQPDPGH